MKLLERIQDYTLCAGKTIKEINTGSLGSMCAIIFTDDTYVYLQATSDNYDNEISFDEKISYSDLKSLGLERSDVTAKYLKEKAIKILSREAEDATLENMSADELRKYIRKNKRL